MELKHKIICPKCGAEYMAAEIFYPNSLIGKPANIIKNDDGKVEYGAGSDMDTTEVYTCDYCGTDFTVSADIKFTSQVVTKADDFNEEYESQLYPSGRLILGEE